MTFTFMDLIVIGGFCLSVMTFCFGVMRVTNSSVHKRIDEVKRDFDRDVQTIKDTYVHKDGIAQWMNQIKEIIDDLKGEQNRLIQRVDDLLKFIVTTKEKN